MLKSVIKVRTESTLIHPNFSLVIVFRFLLYSMGAH